MAPVIWLAGHNQPTNPIRVCASSPGLDTNGASGTGQAQWCECTRIGSRCLLHSLRPSMVRVSKAALGVKPRFFSLSCLALDYAQNRQASPRISVYLLITRSASATLTSSTRHREEKSKLEAKWLHREPTKHNHAKNDFTVCFNFVLLFLPRTLPGIALLPKSRHSQPYHKSGQSGNNKTRPPILIIAGSS